MPKPSGCEHGAPRPRIFTPTRRPSRTSTLRAAEDCPVRNEGSGLAAARFGAFGSKLKWSGLAAARSARHQPKWVLLVVGSVGGASVGSYPAVECPMFVN